MTKVLITGVSGFTGRYLAPQLAEAGYEVHGTLHGESGDIPGVSKTHNLDLGDSEKVIRTISEIAPDKVVHLAAISFVAHSDVSEMYRTNIVGTRNVLEGLVRAPAKSSAVLLASSANVYGNALEGMLDETVRPSPANDYGVTKFAAELIAGIYAKRLPLIIVRPFNYTGRGQADHFLIQKIVAHARRRESEIELGNLDVERDFSDVRGVVDAYARLLATPSAVGETFNICSGRATSLQDLLDLVGRISGYDLKVRVNPAFVRDDEVKRLWGSAEKVERHIGPLNMPPLEETLRWMLEE